MVPLPYPFYKSYYTLNPDHIRHLAKSLQIVFSASSSFKKTKKRKHHIRPLKLFSSRPRPYIIQSPWHKYEEINNLTDYFTEECRIQCKFLGYPTPLDYWNANALHMNKLDKSPAALRDHIYQQTRLCNNFRISVAIAVIKLFKATKWLDISAGWGDRLLAALLTPEIKVYCATDPNPCLHQHYQDMINTFRTDSNARYIMIKDGFESAKLPVGIKYDLVFSSPPFFDLETYSDAKEDSLQKNPTAEQWFTNFLIPAVTKAHRYLELGGHMILYMGESRNTSYVPRMCKFLNSIMTNVGSIYYQDNKTIRQFLVWRKNH